MNSARNIYRILLNHINYKYTHPKACKEWLIKNEQRIQITKDPAHAFCRKLMHIIKYGGSIDYLIHAQHPGIVEYTNLYIVSTAMNYYNLPLIQKYLDRSMVQHHLKRLIEFLINEHCQNAYNRCRTGIRKVIPSKICNIIYYMTSVYGDLITSKDYYLLIETLKIPHIPKLLFDKKFISKQFDRENYYGGLATNQITIHSSNLKWIIDIAPNEISDILHNWKLANGNSRKFVKIINSILTIKPITTIPIDTFEKILIARHILPKDKIWLLKQRKYHITTDALVANLTKIDPTLLDYIFKTNTNILHNTFVRICYNTAYSKNQPWGIGQNILTVYDYLFYLFVSQQEDHKNIRVFLKYQPKNCLSLAIKTGDIEMAKVALDKMTSVSQDYKHYAIQYTQYDIFQLMLDH